LDVVLGGDLRQVGDGGTDPLLVVVGGADRLVGQLAVGRGVVGVGAVVAVDGHETITLEGVEGAEGSVDGDLLVVDTETVAVGVGVREETGLEDGVGRRLDTRDQVGW